LVVGALSMCFLTGCGDDDSTGPGKPTKIVAFNGLYYKADSLAQKPLVFAVADRNNNYLPNQSILLSVIDGDGILSPDTMITDSTGTASFTYTFTDTVGHAVIRLTAPDVDTIDVLIRRSTLIPGPRGQGQYVLFDDVYNDVLRFNSSPASVDVDPNYWIVYANYEATFGVVVVIDDADSSETAATSEQVLGVIVNTVYEGTTTDSIPIGIGSTLSDVRTVFGDPDTVRYDPPPPGAPPEDSAVYIRYLNKGLTFYGDFTKDTNIFEIHLSENVINSPAQKHPKTVSTNCLSTTGVYRRFFR
ncbi:MAG: hypothetical protein ACE5K8_10805, partial [Candidatus Zixiibacteriota bacterium]